jgi:hypothetical protein
LKILQGRTFSERQAILEEVESRRIGHRISKERVANLQRFQQDNKGKKSVNIVANYTGTSPRQLSKEKAIVQAVKEKPQLRHIIEQLDSGEITVNEADEKIKIFENIDAENKKKGAWFKIREQVLKENDYKCQQCGSDLHVDVYTRSPYESKEEPENLETLCKDCHKFERRFYYDKGLLDSFIWMFQGLTGFSGKKYFLYHTIGGNMLSDRVRNSKKASSSYSPSDDHHRDEYTKRMEADPHAQLTNKSDVELVSETKKHRKDLIQCISKDDVDYEIYYQQEVLHRLMPVLKDYSEMVDEEVAARRRKDELYKR